MATTTTLGPAAAGVPGTIYLLHFDKPFRHATHYLGWADDLHDRLAKHGTSAGANLLWHVRRAGITWRCARTWTGDRFRERRLKSQGGKARMCPICRPALAAKLAAGTDRRVKR